MITGADRRDRFSWRASPATREVRAVVPIALVRNVLGRNLEPCRRDPLTGSYRTGRCNSEEDVDGRHSSAPG